MTQIFNGKSFADQKLLVLKDEISSLNIKPRLEIILIGDDKASEIYTNLKKKKGEELGCIVNINRLKSEASESEVLHLIKVLNNDSKVNGILVQLPLPKTLNQNKILQSVNLQKDVDGLNHNSQFAPATTKACLETLKNINSEFKNQKIAVVGSNGFVGTSIIKALHLNKVKNIIQVDQNTNNFDHIKLADVVISATGKSNLILGENIKEDCILIDVGAPKPEFDSSCYGKAKIHTPVPGGVGPVTIACLFENLIKAIKKGI